MILYENTIENFIKAIDNRTLFKYIISEYESEMNAAIDPLLKAQWKYMMVILSELVYFGKDFNSDCGIRIDYYETGNSRGVVLMLASETDNISRVLNVDLIPWEEVRMCEEEDMVYYDDGTGAGEQKTVHPSFQLAASHMILSGWVEDESIKTKSMALLYDCEYTRERDIISHYKPEITEAFPTYYINQLDEVSEYVREVVTGGNGKEVLRRLQLINGTEMKNGELLYPGQKIAFSAVRNYIESDEIAWFFIKNPAGTGGSTLIEEIRKEAENNNKDVLLIDKDDTAVPEEFPADRIVVWMYDGSEDEELIEKAKQIADDRDVYVHSLKLDEPVGLSDGGKGLNWIERYLKVGTDKKLEWDPEQYPIVIVDTAEELPDEKGYASVIIRDNIYLDPKTEEICGSNAAKRTVYRKLSKGKKGVYIYPEDPALREYLKKGVRDAKNKYSWLKDYITYYQMDGEQLQKAQTDALKDSTVNEKYSNKAIGYMGRGAWDKLEEQSKNWIISGLLAYHDMKKYDQLLDFSGVCISICKAVEAETGKRLFSNYKQYLMDKYGDDAVEKAPYALVEEKHGRKSFIEDKMFSLGRISSITGTGKDGKGFNKYAWSEFDGYCHDVLLIHPQTSLETMEEHLEYTEKIRLDYRNQAAHNRTMDVIQAKECIDYVVGIMHKLGVMLDAYRF